MNLLYNNTSRKTGDSYFTMSPYYFRENNTYIRLVDPTGTLRYGTFNGYDTGARPVISLNSGTIPASGSGTMSDPYIIETTVTP